MSLYNHQLLFRPLLGGVEIFNPRVNEVGTLGFIAQDVNANNQLWLVSCYHVLIGGANNAPLDGEAVLQPASEGTPVAFVDANRADPTLDCAAARLISTLAGSGSILGLGRISSPVSPEVGFRVIKSGATTGVTEGVIEEVNDDDVVIGHLLGFDLNYDLSLPGDSGSLWLRWNDFAPIALHLSELGDARKRVRGRCILPILEALRFRLAPMLQ
jgi:hypothetical protein